MKQRFVVQIEVSTSRPFAFVAADVAGAMREAGFYGVTITGGEPYESERALLRKERDELAEWYGKLRVDLISSVMRWAEGDAAKLASSGWDPKVAAEDLKELVESKLRG